MTSGRIQQDRKLTNCSKRDILSSLPSFRLFKVLDQDTENSPVGFNSTETPLLHLSQLSSPSFCYTYCHTYCLEILLLSIQDYKDA
jgi:hypothetical protein